MNDNARRLLALGASVALIGVAFQIRGRGDDGGGGGGGDDDGNGTTLVCPPELADACEAAGDDYTVRVEDPAVTADALVAARRADDVDTDVWLVPRSWVEAVSAARELANRPPLLGEASATIARSPVVLVVQESRAAALESSAACGGDIAWRCVGDVADGPWTAAGGQQNWGVVKAGIARPQSAAGIVTLGAAVAQYLGDDLADDGDLRDTLAEEGWRVDDRDLADGLDADLELPDEPGIPRGDVLRVLLDRWSQLV